MIARTWRGWTAATDAERYAEYVEGTGISAYRSTPGNPGAYLMYRIESDRAEFLVVSFWESVAAVREFAGEAFEQAVFYAEDDEFLVARDLTAQHWEMP